MTEELNIETKEHILNGLIAELERARYTNVTMGQVWMEVGNASNQENCVKLAAENMRAIDSLRKRLAALSTCLVFLILLSSCVSRAKPAMVRTTTYHPGMFGAPATTSVTETPYESPAFTAAGAALFSRP